MKPTASVSQRAKGYVLGAIAAATYGMNPLFAVPLYEDCGMNADSVLFLRYLFALPLLAAMLLLRGRSLKPVKGTLAPLALLGGLVALSSLGLFLSYNYMNSGIASTLLFVYPIMVAVIMAVFYRERLSTQTIVCILVATGGIALLYKSEDGQSISLIGTMWVFISALAYAIFIVGVNLKRIKSVPTLQLTFYTLLFGISLFVVRLLTVEELTLPTKWYYWGNVVGLAVFPTAISFVCTTRAIQLIGSTPTAILGALEPVVAILIGVTVLGQWLSPRETVGLAMIIGAVTAVIAGSKLGVVFVRFRKLFPRLKKPKR